MFLFAWIILLSAHMTDALSLRCIYMCCKVLYFILSEDDFEIKSKIYSLKLHLVLNYILNSQDVLYFRNLFFTLFFKGIRKSIKIKNRLFNHGDKDKFYRNNILTLAHQSH
jgi:hypothetical protein